MSGRCRFCGCTHFNPCPEGCGWVDPGQTVCTACLPLARAWKRGDFSRRPNMTRAFARGFFAATDDERAVDGVGAGAVATRRYNPYTVGGEAWRFWYRGYDAAGGQSSRIGTPVARRRS